MVNRRQTQGKNFHLFPPHCCSLAVFNVITQQHHEKEKEDYSSFYSCTEGEVLLFREGEAACYTSCSSLSKIHLFSLPDLMTIRLFPKPIQLMKPAKH